MIHGAPRGVRDGDDAAGRQAAGPFRNGARNDRADVGQPRDAGRLDQNAVGAVLRGQIVQRLRKIRGERAADAAGLDFVYPQPAVLQKVAVDADVAEFVFDHGKALARADAADERADQAGLARAEKAGDDRDARCHDSRFSATSRSSARMGNPCGQAASHAPQPMQSDALPRSFVRRRQASAAFQFLWRRPVFTH